MRHLILRLEAPLMAFGGETIDAYGVIRPFPAVSMLTGLFANALGWRRVDRESHQQLQDRMVFAARIDREPAGGARMTDFQSAAINNTERSWTTRGAPEGRGGGTYQNHLRWRDYYADMRVTVALRLEPAEATPTLDALAGALEEPGASAVHRAEAVLCRRRRCLAGSSEGDTALTALLAAPRGHDVGKSCRLLWPEREGTEGIDANRTYMITDQRNWVSGLHGGGRMVCEGVGS